MPCIVTKAGLEPLDVDNILDGYAKLFIISVIINVQGRITHAGKWL